MRFDNSRFGTAQFGDTTTGEEGGEGEGEETTGDERREFAKQLLADHDIPGGATRDRFRTHLKPAFDDSTGTEWDAFLNTLASGYASLADAREEVLMAAFPDTASGRQLDRLGNLVQTPRKSAESDSMYRARIKVQLRKRIGGGRITDIKTAGALLLDTQPSEITLIEDFSTSSAQFELEVSDAIINNAEISIEEFVDAVREIKAAGVSVIAKTEGSFTHRSINDWEKGANDPTKGYSGTNYTGEAGTYAGIIGE